MSQVRQLFQTTLNLFYPPRCAVCENPDADFCGTCQSQIVYLSMPLCKKCGSPLSDIDADKVSSNLCNHYPNSSLSHLDSVRSVAFFHNSTLRSAIHKFKYENRHTLSQHFAAYLASCYHLHQLNTEIIVPVPLHKSRLKARGYNQSALLAKELSRLINQPVDGNSLIRQRPTQTQMKLKAAERQKNVAGAFVCQSQQLGHKSILLIDDVLTTGATLNACARALKEAQAQSVHGLTLARAQQI